jgi:hypothetical protein
MLSGLALLFRQWAIESPSVTVPDVWRKRDLRGSIWKGLLGWNWMLVVGFAGSGKRILETGVPSTISAKRIPRWNKQPEPAGGAIVQKQCGGWLLLAGRGPWRKRYCWGYLRCLDLGSSYTGSLARWNILQLHIRSSQGVFKSNSPHSASL